MNDNRQNELLRGMRVASLALGLLAIISVGLAAGGAYFFWFYEPVATNGPAVQTVAGKSQPLEQSEEKQAEAGVDQETGLLTDVGWELVKANCTGCHSAALVTQNRATRDGWEGMIRWMQNTQKLWDLGESEEAILDYLAKNYAPEHKGRRENLKEIGWYELGGE